MTSQEHKPAVTGSGDVYAEPAGEILRRHTLGHSETDIRSAARDFIIESGLAAAAEITQEESPTEDASGRVDLAARDAFFEFKRDLFGAGGIDRHIEQLDDYLTEALKAGRGIRVGVLTDGKRWLLRHIGDGSVETFSPPMFELETSEGGLRLYEWLRDRVFAEGATDITPTRENLIREFGDASLSTNQDLVTLRVLYEAEGHRDTIQVKRRLWEDLLRAALGEIGSTKEELDVLFIRHTYLSALIGMVVQAAFGIDIRDLAAQEPEDLLLGRRLRNATGLSGILESDFFAWPTEVAGGTQFIRQMADRVARFDWHDPPADVAPTLYEIVIPADERRQLGEYYTPQWLADVMTEELVNDPLNQRALDPACGSGTFVVAGVKHFMAAAAQSDLEPSEILAKLRDAVTGIDVHPAAVHLARASWALAARDAIAAASDYNTEISAPIYLGDSLQLRYRTGDMFAQQSVTIETRLEELGNPTLTFPMSLVERAATFDVLMSDIADAIEQGNDPLLALDDNHVTDPAERAAMEEAIATMQMLHAQDQNHIWAYYTRNMVRPVVLSRNKVDVVVGNPPWNAYRFTANILREELELQSKNLYGIWSGGKNAANQDIAGLFFARSVDLYLRDSGVIGMVLPHSALQSGQYAKWRTGEWKSRPTGRGRNRVPGRILSVDFANKAAWDLEQLEPNTFFPIASCVVFAERVGQNGHGTALTGSAERWQGEAGSDDVRRVLREISDTSGRGGSPYVNYARKGAAIFPRCLFFVEEKKGESIIQAGQTITVDPRRASQDKVPWKNLTLSELAGKNVEKAHVHDVHLGETMVPYATLKPLQAALPMRRGEFEIPVDPSGPGGVRLGALERRMRERWQAITELWDANKRPANKLDMGAQLDYYGKLTTQLAWQKDGGDRPLRIAYTESGQPTAAYISDNSAIIDTKLYWISCKDVQEAHYLLAIINSDALATAVNEYTTPNWAGNTRDLHKHLWKLPIPEFDAGDLGHQVVAEAGAWAAQEAADKLAELRDKYGEKLTVTIARREMRKWLRDSRVGAVVESAVEDLLGWPEGATPEAMARRAKREERFGLLSGGVDSGTVTRASRAVREYELATGQTGRW